MPITYSTYEAKARFSEVLRQVRAGKTITVSYRGEPVAEIRPIQTPPVTMEERLDDVAFWFVRMSRGNRSGPWSGGQALWIVSSPNAMVERVAYVDTSALLAVAFDEQGGADLAQRIAGFSRLVSSNLLEAELRAAFAREDLAFPPAILSGIEWILPDRVLTPEFATALQAGYLWGVDLWHVATALYISPDPGDLSFVSLDVKQQAVVRALGFRV